jgi:uncharacterized protein
MKKLLLVALLFVSFLFSPACAQNQQQPLPRLITVLGEAEIKVVPDEVSIFVVTEGLDKDLNIAKAQNDALVKKVLAVVKEFQIDPKFVQTSYISIKPRYEREYEKRNFIGYSVSNTISIKLKDLKKLEGLLSKILGEGVSNVRVADFATSELRKHRQEARLVAIKAAKEKAVALAAELGQKVGRPYSISESPISHLAFSYDRAMTSQYALSAEGMAASVSGGTISLGEISVYSNISVSFELE